MEKNVDVSDEAKANLAKVVQEDFISTNGKGIPEGSRRNDVIVNYLSTIAADKRSSASWTLERMAGDYATRLESMVRQHNPSWKPEEAFDVTILDTVNKEFGVNCDI